ncbi:hypothetical protein FRC02_008076 [Tulasnella sp. 418]|nr:hypothetical protein FRC02_008076 [Tulasnella sp. 418]
MPTLWSKINIRDHPPYERALEYAKRTKTTPLSVHINLIKHFSDPSNLDYALDRTLEIISPEVHRVTSLVVEVPFQAGLLRILHAFFRFRRSPPLERLQVMSYEYFNIGIDSETPTDRIFPQGQLLGNIRHLDLDNVDISWNRVRFRNLYSLRVANLGGPTLLAMHHVCAIIGACPRLESLILENLSPSDEIDVLEQINPVPIALPYLRTLQFKQVHVDGFMFRILNARNLVHLTLHELESDGHNEHLPRFIQGLQSARTIRSRVVVSETKLEYLQISKCRFNLDSVEQLIVSSPNLRELYIDSMDCVTDTLFSSLFVSKPVEKGACKKLEILRIVDCQNLTSAEVLKRVVSSRRGKKRDSGVKELERLDVKSCPVSNESKTKKWFERNVVDLCWVT